MLSELVASYGRLAVATGKYIGAPHIAGPTVLRSDVVLLRRILGNLIKNALEASREGQTVSIAFLNNPRPRFSIHNEAVMSDAVRAQVFQRSFTTKDGSGRGLGCYSVKLLTEAYLGGQVRFASTAEAGTTFTVLLPPNH